MRPWWAKPYRPGAYVTAFYGDGKRSEWRFRKTPEELRAIEAREAPRLARARAEREARRAAQQAEREQQEWEAGLYQLAGELELQKQKEQRHVDRHKRCGGKTRKDGTPCQSVAIRPNGRCKWHGALSTGPKTEEGKQRCREATKRYLEAWRAAGSPVRHHKKTPEGKANIAAAARRRGLRQRYERLAEQIRLLERFESNQDPA
jgi:hypothetical protein